MDETAVITNIATILAKDVLLDRKPKIRYAPYPLQQSQNLLEDDEDDGLDIFVYEKQRKKNSCPDRSDESKTSGGSDYEEDSSLAADNTTSSTSTIRKEPINLRKESRNEVNLRISQYLPPKDFEANFHMRKSTFNALLEVLSPLIKQSIRGINGTIISKDSFVSLALWKLTTNQHFEEISRRFKVSSDLCYWSMNNFCDLISSFLNTFISWPSIQQITTMKNSKVSQLLGVIGTKRFDVFLESQDEEISVILQVICTSDLIITDCYLDLVKTYSSCDSHILKKLQLQPNLIPKGYYLIGDNSFPLKSFLITPFTDANTEPKIRLNQFINEKLKIVDQTLNQLVQRFQSMYSLESKNLKEMKKVTETICGLHNFCRRFNDNWAANMPVPKTIEQKPKMRLCETDAEGIRRRDDLLRIMSP